MAQKKGNFVIKNSVGTVVLAGVATFADSANSNAIADITAISEHNNAGGVISALTKNYNAYEMTLELTPGIGGSYANKAALQTAFTLVAKGASITTSGFDISSLNWDTSAKGIVWESSCNAAQEALGTMRITARRFTTLAGAAIDFTAAWADI